MSNVLKSDDKLAVFREVLKSNGVAAWIATTADPHQSEYLPDHWKVREWLSGFTGSAGTLVITHDQAGLWTDSRYHLQAEKQLEGTGITLFKMGEPGVPDYPEWLGQILEAGFPVGFDGLLLSIQQVEALKKKLPDNPLFYQQDLVDIVWADRTRIPREPITALDTAFSGESRADKLKRIREKMQASGAQYHLMSALDDIAWTFNLRGDDIEYNPVFLAYALIGEDDACLFVHERKLSDELKSSLVAEGISLSDYENLDAYLTRRLPENITILLDVERTSQHVHDLLENKCKIKTGEAPAYTLKAIKNTVEIDGIRNAHIRDGAALVKWMYWLDQTVGKERLTEITIADKLEEFRAQGEHFRGLSFNTISGYNGNGAIVHYAAEPMTAAFIKPEGMLLVDSGGQYNDGTTDITRTISLGLPTPEQKQHFTLVLKGHIQLALARFPKNTTGAQLDTLARSALWRQGYNFGHGTGHGVGHFLNVHEGPQRISPACQVALEPGMVTSNEPGLYLPNQYGIRIENLILTIEDEKNDFGQFYAFETLSQCPIDLTLVERDLLLTEEIDWLNRYHAGVYEKLIPFLSDAEREWLATETQAI